MTAGPPVRQTGSPVRQAGIAQAALGFAITSLGACIALLADDLGLPPEQLGWLPATFGFGLLILAPAGPRLLRDGPRFTLTAGSLAVAAGAALLALAPDRLSAMAGALLLGAGGAGFALVTPLLLAGPGAAIQLTKVNAASSIAAVLAPATIGALQATGVVSGRLALLAVVPPLLLLAATTYRAPAAPRPTEARAAVTPSPGPDNGPTAADGRQAERAARPAVARRWSMVVLAVSVEFCFTIWAVARLVETGLSTATAAVLGTAFPIGMAVGRLAGPALIRRVPVVPLGTAVTASGAVLVAAVTHPAPVTLGLVVAGAGVATLYPVALANLIATPRLSAAHAASVGALASGTAILAAPWALARLADVVDMRLAFLITLPLLAALLLAGPRRQ